jgi:hypothetical protein
MAKFKHNKKRNSAFLYETLIQELTKSIISKNKEMQDNLTSLIKETFTRNSVMYYELKLYKAITDTKGVNVLTAEKILNEVKIRHKDINKKKLVSEQNKLVRKIRKLLSDKAFSNFVPDYKNLASISQVFNRNVAIKSKVLLENELITKMSNREKVEKMTPIDNLVYKSFSQNFNKEYGSKLLESQKMLLKKFITSFSNNGLELKAYLNEEVGRLKEELNSALKKEEILSDLQMVANTHLVLDKLESYQSQKLNKSMIAEIIKIQGLVEEIRENAN